jgi:hypothetical protein
MRGYFGPKNDLFSYNLQQFARLFLPGSMPILYRQREAALLKKRTLYSQNIKKNIMFRFYNKGFE